MFLQFALVCLMGTQEAAPRQGNLCDHAPDPQVSEVGVCGGGTKLSFVREDEGLLLRGTVFGQIRGRIFGVGCGLEGLGI